MRQRHRSALLRLSVVLAVVMIPPRLAGADNCSSLLDCFSGAAAAAAGAGAAAGLGALPKVQRRKVDPCLTRDIFLVAAIGLSIILAIYIAYLVTRLPAMYAVVTLGGPAAIPMGLLIICLVAIALSLAVATVWM